MKFVYIKFDPAAIQQRQGYTLYLHVKYNDSFFLARRKKQKQTGKNIRMSAYFLCEINFRISRYGMYVHII